ncbi:MAG TPA: DUF2752 domain-containing protein [Bacteroidales bacterium]|nr:DUF2752 domain-containing protein [Bacteroidales bacterium]
MKKLRRSDLHEHPYLIINILFAGIIMLMMLYSGIFSYQTNDFPVHCIHESITGQPCPSCGLSRSFSAMVRGQINVAAAFNPNGIPVFVFFLVQFFMRIAFSFVYIRLSARRTLLIWSDGLLSFVFFIFSFRGLMLFPF